MNRFLLRWSRKNGNPKKKSAPSYHTETKRDGASNGAGVQMIKKGFRASIRLRYTSMQKNTPWGYRLITTVLSSCCIFIFFRFARHEISNVQSHQKWPIVPGTVVVFRMRLWARLCMHLCAAKRKLPTFWLLCVDFFPNPDLSALLKLRVLDSDGAYFWPSMIGLNWLTNIAAFSFSFKEMMMFLVCLLSHFIYTDAQTFYVDKITRGLWTFCCN